MSKPAPILLALAAFVLAGCAATERKISSTLPARAATDTVYAFTPTTDGTVSKLVADALARQAWTQGSQTGAEYLVTVGYSVSPVDATGAPVFATSSVGGPTMTNGVLITSNNGSASYGGTMWRTTPVPPAGSREKFHSELTVLITKRATGATVYQASAASTGQESSPLLTAPALVQSVFQSFPR